MQAEIPYNYLIDITTLFTIHCSKNAVDLTSDFLGGFDKLTDLSCHVGLNLLKNNDIHLATSIVHQSIKEQSIDDRYMNIVCKVILDYADILKCNFLSMAIHGMDVRMLNHVQVYNATYAYNQHVVQRQAISSELKASFHWHT